MLMHLKIASLKFIYSSFFHILKLGCIFIYVCIKICIQICLTGAFHGSPWPTHWHHAQLTPMYLLCSPEPILHGHVHAAVAARVSTDCNWNYKALTGFLHMPSLGIKSLFVPILPWSRICVDTVLWWPFGSPLENLCGSVKGRQQLASCCLILVYLQMCFLLKSCILGHVYL